MNLRLEAHEGHKLFVWPGAGSSSSIYCRSCDLFLEVPRGLYYLEIEAARVHKQGEGPAH